MFVYCYYAPQSMANLTENSRSCLPKACNIGVSVRIKWRKKSIVKRRGSALNQNLEYRLLFNTNGGEAPW